MAGCEQSVQYISTTALAKKMGKEPREIFSLLSDGGWLIKVDKRWQLTNKGRFEGGVLLEHPKFGEYVAWPSLIEGHPMLRSLPEAQWTAAKLARKDGLPGRLLNLVLQDLGLIAAGPKGWLALPAGKRLGAHQCYVEKSGVPFVSWPEEIGSYAALKDNVKILKSGEGSLSGRQFSCAALQVVDSWLYLQGYHYRSSQIAAKLCADFYFPYQRVGIVLGPSAEDAAAVAARLSTLEALRHNGVTCIELTESKAVDVNFIDEWLSKQLLQVGIISYP